MPKRTVPIFADGDQERLRELEAAVSVANRKAQQAADAPARGGDPVPNDAVAEAQAAFDAFMDEAAGRAEEWVLSTIGFREFRALLKDHPPRTTVETAEDGSTKETTDPNDDAWGVNIETFPEALLLFMDADDAEVRTIHGLKVGRKNIGTDVAAVRKRVRALSEGEFDSLWTAAFLLNKAGVSDPKLNRFSPATLRSNET